MKACPNGITINNLRNMYDPKSHPYIMQYGEPKLKEDFNSIIDAYLYIKRMNRGNFKLNRNDFEDFFKFFSFAIQADNEFIQIVSNCFYLDNNELSKNNLEIQNQYPEVQPTLRELPPRAKTPNYAVNEAPSYISVDQEKQKQKEIEILPIYKFILNEQNQKKISEQKSTYEKIIFNSRRGIACLRNGNNRLGLY